MNKDELVEELRRDKDNLIKLRSQLNETNNIISQEEKEFAELEAQYLAYKRYLQELKVKKDSIVREGRGIRSKLPRLEAQLRKELKDESLYREFNSSVERIKNSLPFAPWLRANRIDGEGALEHQIDGAARLAVCQQAILADKTGLGKTLTSLIWLDFVNAKRVAAIVPGDTMEGFIRQVLKWTDRKPIKLGKQDKLTREFLLETIERADEFFVVLNYEAWRRDESLVKSLVDLKLDSIILDEAHHAKKIENNTTRGVHNIRFGLNDCPNCHSSNIKLIRGGPDAVCEDCGHSDHRVHFSTVKNVLPMTGTPILNRPQELFPQLKLILPEEFPAQSYFLNNYCRQNAYGYWIWNYGSDEQIAEKLGPRFLQRDEKSAGVEIPPQEVREHLIELEDFIQYKGQFAAYRQMKKFAQVVLDSANNTALSAPIVIAQLLRLRQILVWPAGVQLKDPETGEFVTTLPEYPSVKLDKAEELIKEILDEGDRLIVFSQFTEPLKELQNRFGDRGVLHIGATNQERRNEIVRDFDPNVRKDTNKWDVVFGTYKTFGEGLNLHSARQAVILDYEWNPGKRDQAYARIHRLGQTQKSIVHTIEVEKTIDTWMRDLIEEKEAIIKGFESSVDVIQRAYDALKNDEM